MLSSDAIALDRVPFMVGVTGHRDVAASDEAALRSAFSGVLADLAKKHPHTRLVVMSGLAAGADILAAEEAAGAGIPVIAALPMPVERYEEDFNFEERARFRAMLARCSRITVVSDVAERTTGYVATGLFLVHYAHVLVAFWDGMEGQGAGGTADVVRTRMTGETAHLEGVGDIPYLPDVGPVYQIVTPRIGRARPDGAFLLKKLYTVRFAGDDSSEEDFSAALKHLDQYNADLAQYGKEISGEPTLGTLRERTDRAANVLQKQTNFFLGLLFVFLFVGAAAQITTHLLTYKVGSIVVALIVYFFARRHDYENRYQDYRALTEGLRVQEAWYCAGLTTKLVDVCYLRMQQSELQWIRMALRCAYLLFCEDTQYGEACPTHATCREWIDGQWSYYKTKRVDQARRQQLVSTISNSVLAIGAALFAIAGGISLADARWHFLPPARSDLSAFLTVPLPLAALVGTLLWQYSEKRSYAPNARRYQRMFIVFDRARTKLQGIGDVNTDAALAVIDDLGQEALIEHGDWLLSRRDRPLSLAHA
jgi:hypothetical protein